MQYRDTIAVKKEVLSALEWLLRLAVFTGVCVYLYTHFRETRFTWEGMMTGSFVRSPLWWICVLLVPVNLGLEALKWQFLVSRTRQVSFYSAMNGVLSGLACGLITPRAVGEYAGRLSTLNTRNRIGYVGPLMLSRMMQLSVTVLFGSIGLYFAAGTVSALVCAASAPLIVLFCGLGTKMKRYPGRKWARPFLTGLEAIRNRDILRVFGLSLLRYSVFTLQFVLLLTLLTEMDLILIAAGVTWIFLAKSVLPSLNFLGDLGVREFSAVYFFSLFGEDTLPVLSASLMIWALNIALPAMAGGMLLFIKRSGE